MDLKKALVLDLIYPAVLGTMIVLIFLTLTESFFVRIVEPPIIIAIIVAIYYCMGFLRAKSIEDDSYGISNAGFDFANAIAIFGVYHNLGINSAPGGQALPNPMNEPVLPFFLTFIFMAPIILRQIIDGEFDPWHRRNLICYAFLLVTAYAYWSPSQFLGAMTANWLAGLYSVIFLLYLIDLFVKGLNSAD